MKFMTPTDVCARCFLKNMQREITVKFRELTV